MILVIDNYDSFSHNVVQYIGELGYEPHVIRNDELTLPDIERLAPAGIVITSGSGSPVDAGICCGVVEQFGMKRPLLGVSLGLHCIVHVYGGRRIRAQELMHGKTSRVFHEASSLYEGVPSPFVATQYYSYVIDGTHLPTSLEITARTEDGIIMGVRHRRFDVEGVQFHPESILTEHGKLILANFLRRTHATQRNHVAGGDH